MTRTPGRFGIGITCLLALSACTGSADEAGGDSVTSESSASPTAAASSARPSPSRSPSRSPSSDGPETPAATAGSMSLDSFPSPRQLGAAWEHFVDEGSAEDGYTGNGTPALERDVTEVMQAAVPLGCKRSNDMPLAEHALEVDYLHADTTVIAIKAQFSDPKTARSFFDARDKNLQACRGDVSVPAEGVLVSKVERVASDVLLSDRTPESAPWSELSAVRSDTVLLLAAQSAFDTAPFTKNHASRLAKAFLR